MSRYNLDNSIMVRALKSKAMYIPIDLMAPLLVIGNSVTYMYSKHWYSVAIAVNGDLWFYLFYYTCLTTTIKTFRGLVQ